MSMTFRLGLIINPFAGIGGATGLKGSDGQETRALALARGAEKLANQRALIALRHLQSLSSSCEIYTVAGEMGEDAATSLGLNVHVVYTPASQQTEADDTKQAAQKMLELNLDALIFAGGDGTATDIHTIVGDAIPVVGIPAGCKIHSGVYAVSPTTAGKLLQLLVSGELVSVREAEVRDIDEDAFRQGNVIAKHVGEMRVPEELRYIQAVKMGGKESDELLIQDMGDYLAEIFDDYPDTYFVIGSGSTITGAMEAIGLTSTLLGVDLVLNGEVIGSDLTAAQLVEACAGKPTRIIVTLIGGQGHILGRGNQQISAELIRHAGIDNLLVLASKRKIQALDKRPIVVDSGDPALDAALRGSIEVVTGYNDHVLYPVTDYVEE